jgi:hypothetical protein
LFGGFEMKTICLFITIIILILSGCSSKSEKYGAEIDWVDFIIFNNIHYSGNYYGNNILQESDIECKIGKVNFKVSENIRDPEYKIKNGDAAFLEKGTVLYKIRGYKSEFRIAVKQNNKWRIYESAINPKAKKGDDLLDIRDKVAYIGINSETDGKTELASIKDKKEVNYLVNMVLESEVNQKLIFGEGKRYFISFHLLDKTDVTQCYWVEACGLSNGIILPKEFGAGIEKALKVK